MSKESRLAAKKRSAQARNKRIIKKVIIVVLCLAVIAGIALAVRSVVLKKQAETIDYSYVTDNGTIKSVDASKAVSLPDYKNMGITKADYLPTEDEITESVNDYVTGIEEANISAAETEALTAETEEDEAVEGDETEDDEYDDEGIYDDELYDEEPYDEEADEEPVIDVDAVLTDGWVEANASSSLGDRYPHTVQGLRDYHRDNLQNDSLSYDLESDITDFLIANGTVDYPESLVNRVKWNLKNQEEELFKEYSSIFGVDSAEEYYASVGIDFDAETEAAAREELSTQLICLAIFEKEGFTLNKEDLKNYYEENDYDGTSYDDYIASTSENYYYLQAKVNTVMEFLKEQVK